MAAEQSLLARNRSTITIITATAVVLTLLALSNTSTSQHTTKPLRRRNAVRRSRRLPQVRVLPGSANRETFGVLAISLDGHTTASTIDLPHNLSLEQKALPTIEQLAIELESDIQTASAVYERLAKAAVTAVLAPCIVQDLSVIPTGGPWTFSRRLAAELPFTSAAGISERYAPAFAAILGSPLLEDIISAVIYEALPDQPSLARPRQHNADTSTQTTADELKGLLYYIAEEQAKRKAYQHRGIRCEECGESPIRNIRWHCLNCPDFDLCSTCKSLTAHQKNHIFAEIKIPLPVLAQPTTVLPPWYPGNDIAIAKTLSAADRRTLAQAYDCDEPEIDALADQFICFANAPAVTEPAYISAAIDRTAFAKAISSEKWRNRFVSNLFCDRMFRFYDSTQAGRIGFEQFVSGSCYLRRGKRRNDAQYLHRALDVFDINGDGLFCRSQFLDLLQAKYDLHRVLIGEIAEAEEGERTKQAIDLLHGNQPIGTIFHGEIPHGRLRDPMGKTRDHHGDLVPTSDVVLNDTAKLALTTDSFKTMDAEELSLLGLGHAKIQQQHRLVDEALLWDIIKDALNETLNLIFNAVESRMARVLASKTERARWRHDIDARLATMRDFTNELKQNSGADPLLATADHTLRRGVDNDELAILQTALRQGMVSTEMAALDQMETDLSRRPLEALLRDSGYGIHDATQANETTGTLSEASPDPTMPQNRPDRPAPKAATMNLSDERLEELALIELDAKTLHIRGNEVYLTKDDIVSIARLDQSRSVDGLILSWLSWAAF